MLTKIALPRGFERLTQTAIQSIVLAQQESKRLEHRHVGAEQMLVGLLQEGTGLAAQVLRASGLMIKPLQAEIEKHIGRESGTPTEIPFTPRAKRALEIAVEQSQNLGHNLIGTEHLLLGILLEGEGLAVQVLHKLRIRPWELEQQLRQAMSALWGYPMPSVIPSLATLSSGHSSSSESEKLLHRPMEPSQGTGSRPSKGGSVGLDWI